MRPDVSVIIPMFNAGATISQALESACAQQGLTIEVIVVNDGSTDDGAQAVEQFAQRDRRARLISQSNQGLAAARNAGIAASRGEFLHFLDADDWLAPLGLTDLLSAARGSESGAAYGGSMWRAEDGSPLDWTFEPSCPMIGHQELLECGRFQPACQLIARATLADLCFRGRHPGAEDHDLWLRLAERGVRWVACDRPVCAYRLRRTGMSRGFQTMGASQVGATCESFDRTRRRRGADSAIDLSLAREATIVDRIALDHATGAAMISERPGDVSSGRLLARLGRMSRVTAEQAAASALWMIPYADCQAPNAWSKPGAERRRAQYLRAALMWWASLSQNGLAAAQLAQAGAGALAGLIPDDRTVASHIVARIEPDARIALYGLGRPARALIPQLVRRGAQVVGVDDALGAELTHTVVAGVRIQVAPLSEALVDSATCIIGAERDAAMIRRIPSGVRILRWNEARGECASVYRAEFQQLYESGGAHIWGQAA